MGNLGRCGETHFIDPSKFVVDTLPLKVIRNTGFNMRILSFKLRFHRPWLLSGDFGRPWRVSSAWDSHGMHPAATVYGNFVH